MKYYILYNPLAGKKTGREILENIPFFSDIDEKVFCNLTEIEDFGKFLSDIEKDAAPFPIVLVTIFSVSYCGILSHPSLRI